MASGGTEDEDGGIPLDIDNVHMLLQVEHEQIQKRTFTNWINAQLAKRWPPSHISDLFSDLSDGSQLLDLLEVLSGQPMKRQRGCGPFQQRTNIETALNFLTDKSIKLVNINIPHIIDGRPSVILGLVWTIILHCHTEELADTVPAGRTRPRHNHFKKNLLKWVRNQCQRVDSSVSVNDFKSSWRSGEAFLAILCSLRPHLVDLSLVQNRSNQENLEEAFHLAERELHIPRLLEPQDVDVNDPDEKSIMTYVAQFLQYSSTPAADDDLQTLSEAEVTCGEMTRSSIQPVSQKSPSPVTEETGSPFPTPTHISISKIRDQANRLKSNKTSPQALMGIMACRKVHSKAQSMAKSRMEEARLRVQGHIQQAIKLFGGREVSESQARKKQKALTILQPAILEEFLDAVESFSAFCSETQLHELMVLSDAVRKQWEVVRREMAAFVSVLWSKCSIAHCEMHANAPQDATDQTDHGSLQRKQAAAEGAASAEQRVESLRELSETLTPSKSSYLATDQLWPSAEEQGTQPSDTHLPAHGRRRPPGGNTPLRATDTSACVQPGNNLLPKQSLDIQQQDLSPVAGSVPLHDDTLSQGSQDVPAESKDHLTQLRSSGSGRSLQPSHRAPEELQKAGPLQQTPTHVPALVRGDTVEAKQEAAWTVVSEAGASPQDELSSEREALERYRKSCLVFQCQLQTNKKDLEKFTSCPVTISTLQNQKKQLEAFRHDTEVLWFELELQYGHISQSSPAKASKDLGDVESNRKQMTVQWRDQQMHLQSRMASLEITADLLESADKMELITQKTQKIIRESVEISSFSPIDPRLVSELKEMDATLQSEIKKISEQMSNEQSGATSVLHHSVCHLEQLREQLETVQSAARGLDRFLAAMREVKAAIPTLQANQDPSKLQNQVEWEQERHSRCAALMQRLQAAAELSDSVDSSLKAAGMTLTMGGAAVTCQDVVRSLSKHVVDVEKKLVKVRKRESKDDMNPVGKEKMHEVAQDQEKPASSGVEEESPLEARRSRLYGENGLKAQEEGAEQREQTQTCRWDVKHQRGRAKIQDKGQKESMVQRRVVLIGALGEIRRAAEHLGLQEPSLPALQHRSRVLTELESRLAGLLAELRLTQDASSETPDVSQAREEENLWEETAKAVSERLEQCCILTELLKKFQSIRGDLGGTLHRAESTISQQASYMSRDNLQRTHSKVQGTKAQLNGLGELIEELRSVCRQLDTHLRQFPECSIIPFEGEADGVMDQWLDISERTDSHLDDLQVALNLWDGVLQLGKDVESRTTNKLAVFSESPSFQIINTLQNELEETIERFHRKATEIQSLLQTKELPLELQMVGTQMKKKVEELKELVSEAEDVYRQTVAAKGQITIRLEKCLDCLQKTQDSLLTVSGSDVATVLAKLKEQCYQLQTQEELAESLLEDLRALASVASPDSLQNLFAEGVRLQERVKNTHQLFSEVQNHTEKNIQDLDRLQREKEQLEQWLQTAEEKSAKEEDPTPLQEEALQQRERTELISQLVSSLQKSSLQEATPVEESRKLLERYHGFSANILGDSKDGHKSRKRDVEKFQPVCTSTQSCIRDERQLVNSLLGEHIWNQSPVEQKLHHTQAVVGARAEGQTRTDELSVTGNSLDQGFCDGDALNHEIQENIQTTEQQWGEESAEPSDRVLQADLTSSYQAQRQEAHCRVEELTCQIAQLPTLFPWPGRAQRRQAYNRACQLCSEAESLQLALITTAQQRSELAEDTNDSRWKDATSDKLEDDWSGMMAELKGVCSRLEEGVSNEECLDQLLQDCHHKLTTLQERMSACQAQKEASVGLLTDFPAVEDSLQEVTDIEKDLLQLSALKDSLAGSSTAEAEASLSQRVSNLQSHKGAVESSIREHLALVRAHQQRHQQMEEASCAQTALKDLTENLASFCGKQEELPDITKLREQWCAMQVCDVRLAELASRVDHLQKCGESSVTQEMIRADVLSTADTVSKDLNSLRTVLPQKEQECSETTAKWVRQAVDQLQQWSQMVQTEASTPDQVVLDEGLLLQQRLHEMLSERKFLVNCLGTEASKKLEKCASDALSESTCALNTLSKQQAFQGRQVVETFRSEGGSRPWASPEETTAVCPPALSYPSATDDKNSSDKDQTKIKGTSNTALRDDHPSTEPGRDTNVAADASMEQVDASVACDAGSRKQHVRVPNKVQRAEIPGVSKSETQLESHQLTQQENTELLQEDKTSVKGSDTKEICITSVAGSLLMKPDESTERLSTQPEASDRNDDVSVTPKNVVTIILNMEPQESVDPDGPRSQEAELCSADLTEVTSTDDHYMKPPLPLTATKLKSLNVAAQSEMSETPPDVEEKECDDASVRPKNVFTIVLEFKPQDTQQRGNAGASSDLRELCSERAEPCNEKVTVAYTDNPETGELMHSELLDSSTSCHTVSECQLSGVSAAQTTFPDVKQEEVTDVRHREEQAVPSVSCPVEDAAQVFAGNSKQKTAGWCVQSRGHAELAEGGSDLEGPKPEQSQVPERRDNSLLKDEGESELLSSLADTRVSQRLRMVQGSMEPERTAEGLTADSPETYEHRSTMQETLSGIQSAVERSKVINRTPHIDLNWYLQSSPGELELRLVRTVQQVLACRYQPAQLDITAMAKQLKEAEEFSVSVQEQVATMRSCTVARVCDSNVLKRAEEQWSTALLDASATVQVKAAQLEQVKQYHKHMKMTRAFLEVLAAEKEKMSIDALGSSAAQADKLCALMQTMNQKKSMMEELLRLSSQLLVHLSDAESSGALLAWLGDVQERWRLLEGCIRTALQQASNSTSQFSFLMKEAKQLKAKLEVLQKSSYQSSESKNDLELVCLCTDLKLYNQLYLQLKSQLDALVHFSLGQKEKDEIQHNFQELGFLLSVTKEIVGTSAYSCGGSSGSMNKQLRDLIIWAKQAENHISIGKTLALFPEEARIQIAEMKKFQTDILCRRSKMQVQVEEMKLTFDVNEEGDQVMRTIEDLYEAIVESLDHVLDSMTKDLQEREKLLSQFASIDAWLAEMHAKGDLCSLCGENVSKADIQKLESALQSHKSSVAKIESRLSLVEEMTESCRELVVGLSPGESRHLVNRLSSLWTELNGLLAHEKSTSWELEELIHERTTSDVELCTIQSSLKLIARELEQHRFPLTQETLSTIACLKHMLTEHQCQAQALQHCQDARRSSLLHTIGELRDRCRALSVAAFEQSKYQYLRKRLEETMDIVTEHIQFAKDDALSVDERFTRCQTLLVELPTVKTQCQEARDQLEVVAQELQPCELTSERQRINSSVGTLVSWEHSVTSDIKNLEAMFLPGLRFSSELPALVELFQRTSVELETAKPVSPDQTAIQGALQRYWVIWRNVESGMRVLEAVGQREKVHLKNYQELYSLRDATMQKCWLQMENLSQAQESLKHYLCAAQGALGFLRNADATFLSAAGSFLDCAEEHRQTQQALERLEDGFQTHICQLGELVPLHPCLSQPHVEQLHISILSELVAGRAVLEARAQLWLEASQSCAVRQQSHRVCHKELQQRLDECETRLSECSAVHVTSCDKWLAQQQRTVLLMEHLHNLAGKVEELRTGCPSQGCGAGEDGELGALWRRWMPLRRRVGLLMARTQQKGEEWKDITASLEQCCSFLAILQSEVLDSSSINFSHEDPQELLAQAEMHHAGLEQAQQALATTEHRLEHALNVSTAQHSTSAGPVGKTLMKIQENMRSLKERNLLVVAAAQAEEEERRRLQEEMGEAENHMVDILLALKACTSPGKQQELKIDLSSQKTKVKCIIEGVQSRYGVIPADISGRLQDIQLSLQRAEEKFKVSSGLVQKLAGRVMELVSGLENVKGLLEQRSPTVSEAQNVLKRVWDKLDVWHSRLMLLESEVQDLAEEQPDRALVLMDQLTQPLQLYQDTAQMAEQRTSFLSKIPAYLQEFEDVLYSATCWLDEAQSWLNTHCTFTTARSLQNHANSLQLLLDDSERNRVTLRGCRSVFAEISAVCDISTDEERLEQTDQQVYKMQCSVLEPLKQLLQAAEVVETVEAELTTMEKNIPKIRAILSSMETSDTALMEHLQNREVILANVQSMQRTLMDMEKCRGELRLPEGGEENLMVFSRAELLLQQLEELKLVTQQQEYLLEIQEEEGADANPDITTFSKLEVFEMSISDEEDEDGMSCHSSSSDTLTCDTPEDPEETFKSSEDVTEPKVQSEAEEPRSFPPSDMETSSKRAETGVLPVKSASDLGSRNVETGLKTISSQVEVVAFSLETGPVELLIPADAPAATDKFPAADALEQQETLVSDPPTRSFLAAAALERTRLIPDRPITPFAAATPVECIEGGDAELFTAPDKDMVMPDSKEQLKASTRCSRLEESQAAPIGSTDYDDHEEQQSWSRLYTRISQKLTTLKKVHEQHQTLISTNDGGVDKLLQRELVPCGSASAVLEQTHESILMLRRTVRSAGTKEELYDAVQKVLLCLDSLTDFISTPCGSDDAQLKLLQQERVLNDLVSLDDLLMKSESAAQREPVREEAGALHCLTCLRDCLRTVQLVVTSSQAQLVEHQGFSSNQLCTLEEFDVGRSEIFPSLQNAPSLEQCVLGRHLRERPGEKARLQQASWSLLQGIIRLLDLGEECKTVQMSQVHNLGQHQAVLCGHKKLLQVLGSQLAFVQHLFQREPEALKCQEDDRVQLEVRARALQQRALEQEVAFQTRLQEWTRWEDNCGQLGRVLDELEAFISNGEPERDDESCITQHRLDACQQTLVQLDESRAALGLFQDQRRVMLLQTEPVSWAGGSLELRWRSVYGRTEQEVQRCKDVQDSWTRFQTDFGSISEWLVGANKHLRLLSDLDQECIHRHLIELLDFSMGVEAVCLQKASVSREGTKLVHLREADSPRLRAQLTQLDVSWSQLTSDLSKMQDQLQQRLVAGWPPMELLSDLSDWLKKRETQLNKEKETVLKAEDAAHINKVLQHLKEIKAGLVSGQLLLDFLSQSGPQVLGAEVQTRSERTLFAETLGALRLQWMDFDRDVENQICRVEQMHHTCADSEKRLKRLDGLIEQQKEQLNKLKQLISQTQLRKALEDWEAVEGRVKEVAAALQELKATRVDVDQEEVHPCDGAVSIQAERLINACGDLCQQMESLRPGLEQTLRDWTCYDGDLREVCLHCTRVRCELQHQRAPLLSLKQAQGHVLLLQQLEEKAGEGEELWATVRKSYQRLVKSLHCGTAQALSDRMGRERKRWEDVMQDVKDELTQTAETVSLWQEYSRLSENCSLRLQSLWHQWEELSSSSFAPEHNTQASLQCVENLQAAAEVLQRSVGDVLAASKPLTGQLEPLASTIIQSETGLASRKVLLLNWAISGRKKSLQENLDEQKLFNTRLEALDQRMRSVRLRMEAGFRETDSVQVLLEFSGLFLPLLDVRDMSGYVILDDQEAERLQMLSREWIESMTRTCDMNRELLAENLICPNFEEKCKNLASIREKLDRALATSQAQSCSRLPEMLSAQQRLQAEVIAGHQLLQSLLCDAVSLMEKETGEKRSELVAQVSSVKLSWFNTVALTEQCRRLIKQQLRLWWTYRHGLTLVRKLLRDVEPLLPPPGPAPCALLEDYQCVKEALRLHITAYTQTMEAGRRLYETMTESESRSQLQSESRTIKEAWECTTALLERRTDLAKATVQKRSQCQEGITNIVSELDELKTRLNQQLVPEEDAFIQETELFLQRVGSGLRDLGVMKTDLSQYVAASDSALLEQQLEQLHGQWEELCMKVSLRRQEIADRVNAWTIFNGKNKEFCDWLTQMENKVCHSGDLSIEEMVEKLKKDCMEEINLFSENKSHLKQLGEQLLLASDEAKQTQVHGSLQEINQRWHSLFHHIEARVKKLKETLVTVQQLDKNMSTLRLWLSRIEAELSRPITYSVCHHQEIQKRLAEQQELQKDIEQHTEGVASVLSLCDVLLRDEDVAGGSEVESDSLQETSRSLDQRWRTICALALDRRLRIEETWRLWCKFLEDYSRFEDWLKLAERSAANPNSADVLYTVAKEELKKFEGFQRQVHERLTQLELVNNQYRRLARENRTDRASQLKAMVHEGNRRWDALHRRVAAVLRRLKHFTSQREEFEGTRESMLVWLTELDLQLTNVEHFSESDVHHKMQQLNSFQKEITLNTERMDGLIVFGEGLIQKSSPQDAALIEDELEELHSYCQEVFSRLVRFHQRLSQPPIKEEPKVSTAVFSLELSLELICRPWLGRSQGSLPATPTHLLSSPLERSGRETPLSVDSLALEWDPSGDVGGSSSHEDEEEEDHEEEGAYFSALSVSSQPKVMPESPRWLSSEDTETESVQLDSEDCTKAASTLTSTQGYLRLTCQCSGSIENIKRVSLILDEEDQPQELGLTGLTASDKQSGVIERWELLQAQPASDRQIVSDLTDITLWLEDVIPKLDCLQPSDPAISIEDMEAKAKELKQMQKMLTRYKSVMLSVNLQAQVVPDLQEKLELMNRDWSRACTGLQQWETSLRKTLMRCQEFHEALHSLLLWLVHAESRRYTVDVSDPETTVTALQQHHNTLTVLQEELRCRQAQQASLQALWSQLQPKLATEESDEAQEKLHVTGRKLKLLLKDVDQDLSKLRRRLTCESVSDIQAQRSSSDSKDAGSRNRFSTLRDRRASSSHRSFFYRVLRAAFPLQLLLLLLLLLPCLIPLLESDPGCTVTNNFARSFYPMLHYTNGPPPT